MIEIPCILSNGVPSGGSYFNPPGVVYKESSVGFSQPLQFIGTPDGPFCLDQKGVTYFGDAPYLTLLDPPVVRGVRADWAIRNGMMLMDSLDKGYALSISYPLQYTLIRKPSSRGGVSSVAMMIDGRPLEFIQYDANGRAIEVSVNENHAPPTIYEIPKPYLPDDDDDDSDE